MLDTYHAGGSGDNYLFRFLPVYRKDYDESKFSDIILTCLIAIETSETEQKVENIDKSQECPNKTVSTGLVELTWELYDAAHWILTIRLHIP